MAIVPNLFTSGEVRSLARISQRQLSHWDQSGLVCPSGRTARGRGSRRLYTLGDLVRLKIVRRLAGRVSLQKIRKALDVLSNLPNESAPLAELEILTDGERILVIRSDEQILDPLASQYVLRFPISDLLAEMRDVLVPGQPESEARTREAVGIRRARQ